MSHDGRHGNTVQMHARVMSGTDVGPRSANLPQPRNMAAVNDGENVSEEDDDELYSPCGEAVPLKNSL